MVTYKKNIRKKLKHRTLKYMKGGGMVVPSPFMMFMKSIKNLGKYLIWALPAIPAYASLLVLNSPLTNMRNATNGRTTDSEIANSPIYELLTNSTLTKEQIDELDKALEEGSIQMPLNTDFFKGHSYHNDHIKGLKPEEEKKLKESGGQLQIGGNLTNYVSKLPGVSGGITKMVPKLSGVSGDITKMTSNPLLSGVSGDITKMTSNPLLPGVQEDITKMVPKLSGVPGYLKKMVPKLPGVPGVTTKMTTNPLLNKTVKKQPTQFQLYYDKRFKKPYKRETIINMIKSNLLTDNQKSIDTLGREYDTSGKSSLYKIYRMPMEDKKRIIELQKYIKKLESTVLLKSLILFNTIFDNSGDGSEQCDKYLNDERKEMGINGTETENPTPTYFRQIPIVTIPNIFKYKEGLNPLDFGSETFAKCLKTHLTKTELSDDDMKLCVDMINQDCKNCTLNTKFREVLNSLNELFTGKVDFRSMINALFNILKKMYDNHQFTQSKNPIDYENSLIDLYLNEMTKSQMNLNELSTKATYKVGTKYNLDLAKFIGQDEIKMFKDLMCKYKLREKIAELYNEKRKEEIDLLKKRGNRMKHDIKTKLISFLDIYIDKTKIGLNGHLSMTDINTKIDSFIL
jgi:hypothetical protein